VAGAELDVLSAAGHSMNQIAIATPEAAYLADALMAPEILERYPTQYCYDVLGHRETLVRPNGRAFACKATKRDTSW
jgi:hypothetical protein